MSNTAKTENDENNKSKLADLMRVLTENAIDTPINVLKEKIALEPREEVETKLNAIYSEMIKLQYRLREYATVEWYDTLDDRRKKLHGVFEVNRDFFKTGSKGKNWLFLTDTAPKRITTETMTDGDVDYFFMFFEDTSAMEDTLAKMRTREVNKCLCVPLFKATK
jgi:hypothetical protein